MKKYSEDSFWLEKYGAEICKQMDDYNENLNQRKSNLLIKAVEKQDELFKAINEKTGLKNTFKLELRKLRNSDDMIIDIESNEIKNSVIALAWKSFKIANFGGGVWSRKNKEGYYGSEEDFSKPSPEIGYTMSLHFAYTHNDGGTNGASIGTAYFIESEGNWKFELDEVRD